VDDMVAVISLHTCLCTAVTTTH